MRQITIAVLLFACATLIVNAQKVKSVQGTYKLNFSQNKNMTFVDAERECEKQARLNALENEFGTNISDHQTSESIQIGNDNAQSRYRRVSEQNVKGTWLRNTQEPQFTYSCENGEFYIECEVHGEGRERNNANIDLQWKILVGAPDTRNEGSVFNNGQKLFIEVKIPVDGYLAVCLVEEKTKKVSRLLPYKEDKDGVFDVQHGKKYILFDKDNNPRDYLKRYEMSTNEKEEIDRIVLIFSQKRFTQCYSEESAHIDCCTQKEFEEWLDNLYHSDDTMVSFEQEIRIRNIQ